MDIMTLAAKITLDTSEYESGIKNSESSLASFGKGISSWTVAKGQMIADFAKKAAGAAKEFVTGALDEGKSFDKSMSQVAATMGKSVADLENEVGTVDTQFGTFTGNLREYARFMGENTAFSATQAADALNYMALAGYTTEQSLKMLPNVLNLAAAGGLELATASDMITDAQSALGLSAEETTELVDKMAMTASKTNTSVGQLGEGILQIGGTAKQLKGGTTELTAMLGALADNGMKGAEGGTLLRNVLKNLTAPSKEAAKQMKQMGLNVFDAKGNMRSMDEIMGDLKKKLEGKTDKQRSAILNKLFDARNLKAVEALMGKTSDDWKELYGYIEDSAGSAEKMAETQLDNLAGDTTKFQSALSEVKLMISDKITPILRKLTQFGTSALQRLGGAFKEGGFKGALQEAGKMLEEFITKLENSDNPVLQKVGEALRTVKNVLKWLWQNKETVVKVIGAIVGAFAVGKIAAFVSALNPVTLALGLIAAAAALIVTNWDAIKETAIKIWNDVTAAVNEAWDAIQKWWSESITEPLKKAWGDVKQWFEDNISGPISGFFKDLFQWIDDGIKRLGDLLGLTAEDGTLTPAQADVLSTKYNNKGKSPKAEEKFYEDLNKNLKESKFTAEEIETITNAIKNANDPQWVKTFLQNLTDTQQKEEVIKQLIGDIEGTHNVTFNISANDPGGVMGALNYMPKGKSTWQQTGKRAPTLPYHAKGDWYVPSDDYLAELHRGEMVLTASQARKYRDGEDGGSLPSFDGLFNGIVRAVQEGMANAHVDAYMDGKKVTRESNRINNNELLAGRFRP